VLAHYLKEEEEQPTLTSATKEALTFFSRPVPEGPAAAPGSSASLSVLIIVKEIFVLLW
jgi:hypothetical protein